MKKEELFDVVIVGGNYAGLSAGMVLGRSLRKVLIIDSGKPCNRQTPHSQNFLTRDGETPAQISAIAREQIRKYPMVSFLTDLAIKAYAQSDGFVVETISGRQFNARKLVLATGIEDLMPPITGFAECWGISVLHCPYCHGYEVHGQHLGILANGDTAYEMVRLIQNWSSHLTLFTNGSSTLTPDQRQLINQLNVPIVETELKAIEHEHGHLKNLRFSDGSDHKVDALYSRVPFRQHSDLAITLGCGTTKSGLIGATEFGQTNIPGLYVAGDNSCQLRQLSVAVANGGKVGLWINSELIGEDLATRFRQLVH